MWCICVLCFSNYNTLKSENISALLRLILPYVYIKEEDQENNVSLIQCVLCLYYEWKILCEL